MNELTSYLGSTMVLNQEIAPFNNVSIAQNNERIDEIEKVICELNNEGKLNKEESDLNEKLSVNNKSKNDILIALQKEKQFLVDENIIRNASIDDPKDKEELQKMLDNIVSQRAKFESQEKVPVTCIECLIKEITDSTKLGGKYFGAGCLEETSASKNINGKKPKNCTADKLPRIYYTNGITTNPKKICKTMQKIADNSSLTGCREVVGIYNSTSGGILDVKDSLVEIYRASKDQATLTQVQLLKSHFIKKPYYDIELFCHSEGGIITRQSLIEFRKGLVSAGKDEDEIIDIMSHIKVSSFGTGTTYWPDGPEYQQYSHMADLVPRAINVATASSHPILSSLNPLSLVPGFVETFNNLTGKSRSHIFVTNVGPINAHDMDDSYLTYWNDEKSKENNFKYTGDCPCGKRIMHGAGGIW